MRHEDKTMTKAPDQSLATWRETMGLTQREAAEALGCDRRRHRHMGAQTDTTPRYIKLAMAALALGIEA